MGCAKHRNIFGEISHKSAVMVVIFTRYDCNEPPIYSFLRYLQQHHDYLDHLQAQKLC